MTARAQGTVWRRQAHSLPRTGLSHAALQRAGLPTVWLKPPRGQHPAKPEAAKPRATSVAEPAPGPGVGTPDPADRLSGGRSGARRFAGCSLVSALLHAGMLLAALGIGRVADLPERGGEMAIPVEFIVAAPEMVDAPDSAPLGSETVEADVQPVETPPADVPQVEAEQVAVAPPEPVTRPVIDLAPPPATEAEPDIPPPDLPSAASLPAPIAIPAPALPTVAPPVIEGELPAPQAATAAPMPPERPQPATPAAVRPVASKPVQSPPARVVPQRRPPAPPPRAAARGREDGTSASHASRQGGATGGAAPTAGPAEMANHRTRVLAHLARFKRYPREAEAREIEGGVTLSFAVTPAGKVTSVALARSSGSSLLDQEALAMVRRAEPFPALPGASPQALRFTAAIRFDLR